MKRRKLLRRLALREYLPWIGSLVTWLLVLGILGFDQASRLVATTLLIGAARGLTKVNITPLYRSTGGAGSDRRSAQTFAVRLSLASLAAGILFLAPLLLLLLETNPVMSEMLVILALGFPPRYLLDVAGRSPRRIAKFRVALAWTGVALITAAHFAGFGWREIALLLALREWVALATVVLTVHGNQPDLSPSHDTASPTGWSDIAEASYIRARLRMTNRTTKAVLSIFLGPFAGIVTRTSRGSRKDRKLESRIPQGRAGLMMVAIVMASAGVFLLVVRHDGWTALIACSLIRISCSILATLIWDRLRGSGVEQSE